MKPILIALVLFALVRPEPAQQAAASPVEQGPTAHARLAGTWKVDRSQFPDDQDVWRRRVDAMPVDPAAARPSSTRVPDPLLSSPVMAGSGLEIAQLRTAMRDLLETAERLSFTIAPDSVTITDDLERARIYATTGKKEKRRLAATEFDVKTRWNGEALTQDITVWTFAMTEVYLAKDDGRELLVSITIAKPKFQPPIKDVARAYTRIK